MKLVKAIIGILLIVVFVVLTPSGSDMTSFQWGLYILGLLFISFLAYA